MVTNTTLDRRGRPLRDLRLSVIDRCNFRCPYCMPEEVYDEKYAFFNRQQRLSDDETVLLVRAFAALGVNKLRLTGGEPLLRKDLPTLLQRLMDIDGIEDIAMSTNGVLLPRHAQALRDAGLQRITVSVDSTDADSFLEMSGGKGSLQAVLEGIDAARAAGFETIKINAVIERNRNEDQIVPLAQAFREQGCTLRFIEYMDVGTRNGWRLEDVVTSREIRERLHAKWPLEAVTPGYRGEVATRYRYLDGGGEVGFISSISQPFCSDCTRARLSADGKLYTCLFAREGKDLKTPLRAGAGVGEMTALIARMWSVREDRYSEQRRADGSGDKVEMFQIGG
ncbi:MAG: GTP 3',8-cyclase MoaA [Gammaproteobacteria bacterium]